MACRLGIRASAARTARVVSAVSTATCGSFARLGCGGKPLLANGAAPVGPDHVERRVGSGSPRPRRRLGARVVAESPVEVEEDLLGNVFRRDGIAEHTARDRRDPRVFLVEEPVEARRPDADLVVPDAERSVTG